MSQNFINDLFSQIKNDYSFCYIICKAFAYKNMHNVSSFFLSYCNVD